MSDEVTYSSSERLCLWTLAVVAFVGLNGTFLYGTFVRPDSLASALGNPVAAAFIVESLLLVGVFAYLLTKWRVNRLHWGWFVALSLVGSLAFALPVVLLWSKGNVRGRR